MPFYGKRKKYAKSSKPVPRDTAQDKEISRLRKKVAYIMPPELKFIDFRDAAFIGTTTNVPLITALMGIAQGDADTQRTGDHVNLKSIKVTVDVLGSTAAGTANYAFRAMLVQSMDGTAPTGTQLLERYSVVSLDPSNMNSQYNTSYVGTGRSFRILADKTIMVRPNNDAAQQIKLSYKSNRGMKISYTGAVTAPVGNGLFLVRFAGTSTGAGANNTHAFFSHAQFIDL